MGHDNHDVLIGVESFDTFERLSRHVDLIRVAITNAAKWFYFGSMTYVLQEVCAWTNVASNIENMFDTEWRRQDLFGERHELVGPPLRRVMPHISAHEGEAGWLDACACKVGDVVDCMLVELAFCCTAGRRSIQPGGRK